MGTVCPIFCWPSLCMIKQQGSEWPTNLRESMCQIACMCVRFSVRVCTSSDVCVFILISTITQRRLLRYGFMECTTLLLKHLYSSIRNSFLERTYLESKQLVLIVQSYFRQLVVVYSSLYIAGPHHSVCDGCRSGLSLCSQKWLHCWSDSDSTVLQHLLLCLGSLLLVTVNFHRRFIVISVTLGHIYCMNLIQLLKY